MSEEEQFNDTALVYKFHVVDEVYEVHPPPNTQPRRFILLTRDCKFIDVKDSLDHVPTATRFVFELQWIKGREAHYEVCTHLAMFDDHAQIVAAEVLKCVWGQPTRAHRSPSCESAPTP